MPLLGDPGHKDITASLKNRIPKLLDLNGPNKPRAIILITAHWTTPTPQITCATNPSLLFDYSGFPKESYELEYPAKGDAEIAKEVKNLLEKEGLKGVGLDAKRGWDHGVFVPMLLINPKANVPIIQMSVLESENPEQHLRIGRAISALRARNIAILGSGFASFHNIPLMMALRRGEQASTIKSTSRKWNDWLEKTLKGDRWEGLKGWRGIEEANLMHPVNGGEHFMPLVVCAGAAEKEEKLKSYKDDYLGVEIYTYYWGADEV